MTWLLSYEKIESFLGSKRNCCQYQSLFHQKAYLKLLYLRINTISKCNTYKIDILRLSTLAKLTNLVSIWFSNCLWLDDL